MDTFQALVLDKENEQTNLEVKNLTLDDLPEGDVTIQVAYSSINYKDGMVGIKNQMVGSYPHVPGIDLAGTVIDSADGSFKKGDEVIVTSYTLGTGHFGGFSQVARVPKDWVVSLPKGLSLKEAMILGTAGLTAGLSIQRLEDNGLNSSKGSVLVAGATGGVGSLSVDMLAKKGYNVAASTGKASEAEYLKKLGAKEIIDREEITDTDGTPTRKKKWAAAVDPVGGQTLQYILSTLKYDGSVATSGLAGGVAVSTTVLPFISRGINWLGIDSVQCSMEIRKKIWNRLADDLKPTFLNEDIVSEVPLEEVPGVLEEILEGKVRGRTLVKL
ncbi:putative YhdH/YhfP family quinone oxidoreductase [Virgibacillus natechei]|uniref:YhdH/YhfP family quinone oxidoreductase n=1 Tax=Virgibacillus natechei TaxID=1216297 RepID=A0ABS4IBP4_9BACI|nr:acryloyl-CoA reductase [Virgibacillus natechei]MBP1968357.1 putative YhdH/YhfP family quinone oxidoreductase [Virgibacillus natechei]UZD13488.1 acryloyl-CoA reductase [Virgibacillus natechei]